MKVITCLPAKIKAFSYVKNHHYVALEDVHGNKTKLNATGILVGDCVECKEKCLALSHQGNMNCTHCGGVVKWAWHKPQLAFIPENESMFKEGIS
jgi:hypothetical protein